MAAALIFRSVSAVVWAAALSAGLKLMLLLLYVPMRRERSTTPAPGVDAAQVREQFGYALPFAVSVLFERGLTSVHAFWVSAKVPDAVFAVYAAGVFQVPIVKGLVASIADVIIVRGSSLHEEGKGHELARIWRSAMGRIIVILVPIVAVCELMAPDIIGLVYGAQFAGSVPIFRIFLLALLFYSVIDHAILRAIGDTRFLIWAASAGFVASVVCLPILTRANLLLGGVTSFVIGLGVARLAGLVRVASELKINWTAALPVGRFLAATATSGLIAVPVYFLVENFDGHFVRLLVGGPTFLALYVGMVWVLRLIPRDEMAALAARFRPRELFGARNADNTEGPES